METVVMDVTTPSSRKPRRGLSKKIPRPADDFYPTPLEAIFPLLELGIIPTGMPIWEPSCGSGTLSKVLENAGWEVISTNLKDRGYGQTGRDFFKEKRLLAPVIIGNPPFFCDTEFVLHALELEAVFVAFFLKTSFLEGADRYRKLLRPHPPSDVYQFVDRVVIYSGDLPRSVQDGWSNHMFCWVIWQRGFAGEPRLHWLKQDHSHGRQADLFEYQGTELGEKW